MQLHRHNIRAVKDFSESLEKIAKVSAKDLYSSQIKDEQFKSLRGSTDPYAGMRSFAKGMGVSFAIPLAMGLGMTGPTQIKNQIQKSSQNAYNEFFMSQGLQAGGMPSNNANGIAKMLNAEANRLSVPGEARPNVSAKISLKNVIQEELAGKRTPNLTKSYRGGWVVEGKSLSAIVGSTKDLPIGQKGTIEIVNRLKSQGANAETVNTLFARNIAEPTSEKIIQTNYKGLSSGGMMSPIERGNLIEVGKDRVNKLGIKEPNFKKLQAKMFTGRIKSMAKAPLAVGLVGGVSAYLANKARQKRYKDLMKEVRRRNA